MAVTYLDKQNKVAVLTRSGAVVTASDFSPYGEEDYNVENREPWRERLMHASEFYRRKGIDIALWGKNNLYPLWLLDLLRHNNINSQLIWTKISMAMGHIYPFRWVPGPDGHDIQEPVQDVELKRFLRSKAVRDLMRSRATDYFIFGNTWCKVILTRDRSTVANFQHMDASMMRTSLQNADDGFSPYQYYCPDWILAEFKDSSGYIRSDANVQRFPSFDYRNPRRRMQTVLHSKMYWPGHPYYGVQPWHSAHHWLSYANSMPVWMATNINKAHNIKYHVQYPSDYFDYLENEFDNDEARKKERTRVLHLIDHKLSGATNAQTSLFTEYDWDPMEGKEKGGWKVQPLVNEIKDEAYVKAYYASNIAAISSQGIDPALANIMIEGQRNPSGSDKRISGQIHQVFKNPEVQEIMTEPLRIWRDINGLDPEIEFGFQVKNIVTLAEDPTGITTPPTIQTQERNQEL